MKIGVLTLFKVRNIGAELQAFATKHILEDYGHQVYFLNGYGSEFAKQLFKNDMGRVRPWNLLFLIKKDYKFRRFFLNFQQAEICEAKNMNGVIIGSDSLWVSDYGKDAMPEAYFGDVDNQNIYAYAPSVGGSYQLDKYNEHQLESLRNIRYITVRDEISQQFLFDVLGHRYPIVVDPTLLYDWKSYLREIDCPVTKKNYILIYGGMDKEMTSEILLFARRKGLDIVNIGTYNRFFRHNIPASPDEFLCYVFLAKYVVTTMFHGVMLSLALEKEVRYFSMEKNRDLKTRTVIHELQLDSIMLSKDRSTDLDEIFSTRIDYKSVSFLLERLRGQSRMELEKILSMMNSNGPENNA